MNDKTINRKAFGKRIKEAREKIRLYTSRTCRRNWSFTKLSWRY